MHPVLQPERRTDASAEHQQAAPKQRTTGDLTHEMSSLSDVGKLLGNTVPAAGRPSWVVGWPRVSGLIRGSQRTVLVR
jgi:hypothetical protein